MIDKAISLADSTPFEWGSMDCCQFAGLVAKEKSGKNPMDAIAYQGESGAKEFLEAYGGLFNAVCHFLGEPSAVEGGTDGDFLLGELYNGDNLLGVQYKNRMIVKTERHVVDWPISRALYRWEICRRQ